MVVIGKVKYYIYIYFKIYLFFLYILQPMGNGHPVAGVVMT